MPIDSGLVSITKAHGYYGQTKEKMLRNGVKKSWSNTYTAEEIWKTNGRAVVLIRDPFRTIYGYRHLDQAGHTGHADASQFIASGIFKYNDATFEVYSIISKD